MPQDLPPSGGYEPVQYKVRLVLFPYRPKSLHTGRLRTDGGTRSGTNECGGHKDERLTLRLGMEGMDCAIAKAETNIVTTEESPRERVPSFGDASCNGGRDDLWILEGWERN